MKKKPNAGAIVGGVLGGLVGLAIILLGALWLLKRKRLQRDVDPAPAPPYEVHGQYMYPKELPGQSSRQQGKSHEIYTRESMMPQEMYAGYASPVPATAKIHSRA